MNEEQEIQFHNEGIVSRLTMWGNIVAFIILGFAVIELMWNLYAWYNQVMLSPYGAPGIFIIIATIASGAIMPFLGAVFYFLVLRGMVQLLNLGLDLFYGYEEEEETVAA
jgi:hypothetical protein